MKKLSKYLLTIIITGGFMLCYQSYAQNKAILSQDRIKQSPNFRDGKFHNSKKYNLYSFKINQKELKDISRLMPDYIKLKTEVPLNDI